MNHAPCIPGLLEPRLHPIADTSRMAFERILPTLQARERAVLLTLCDAAQPLTGGEIAQRLGLEVTSIRPRLVSLCDHGLIEKQPARRSTAPKETFARPYKAVVSRAAVERVK